MSEKQFWLVGQYRSGEQPEIVWDFQGIFSTEEGAIAACFNDSCFVAPVTLDEKLPEDFVPWDGSYYPHLEAKP